jgi:ATP-dependent protease ClpP protease subunit
MGKKHRNGKAPGIYSWAANPNDLIRRIRNVKPALAVELGELELDWYRIKNSTTDSDTTEIYVYDVIGGWFGVEASTFAKELSDITTSKITLRINSPGGDVYDSIAIYNALSAHPAEVTVYVDSLAASGASVIAMAGEKVIMMPGSQMMIHDALMYTAGNAEELRSDAEFLDRQSDNIAGLYALKAGGSPEDWRAHMLAETWMFAQEAVDMGLADEVSTKKAKEIPADGDTATDSTTADVFAKLTFRHPLADRGFNYAGRQRAPEPVAAHKQPHELTDEELINMMVGGN